MFNRFCDVQWTLYCGSRDVDFLENEFSTTDEMKRDLKLLEVGKASEHITLSPCNEYIPLSLQKEDK